MEAVEKKDGMSLMLGATVPGKCPKNAAGTGVHGGSHHKIGWASDFGNPAAPGQAQFQGGRKGGQGSKMGHGEGGKKISALEGPGKMKTSEGGVKATQTTRRRTATRATTEEKGSHYHGGTGVPKLGSVENRHQRS